MLPFKRARGRDVYKNIKCHIGVPENLANERENRPFWFLGFIEEIMFIAKFKSTRG